MNVKKISLYLLIATLLFTGCRNDDDVAPTLSEEDRLKAAVWQIMQRWYFWKDQMPDVNPDDYPNAGALLNALRYTRYDTWSFMQTEQVFDQLYEAGQYAGYGFSLKWDENNELRVAFVYKASPAYEAGMRRGAQVYKINNNDVRSITDFGAALGASQVGRSATFEFDGPDGEVITENIAQAVVTMNTVLKRDVFDVSGKKIAYLAFNSFLETSRDELQEAFAYFSAQGATELILDVRYNGGGRLGVAQYLAGLIASPALQDKLLVETNHNSEQQDENKAFLIENTSEGLTSISRMIVIATGGSASASEVMINGMRPYMPVKVVGSDTYGKPVGQYGFRFEGFIIGPVCFEVRNADLQADYFDGIPADAYVKDDLSRDFGDPEELCTAEAIHYLINGSFSDTPEGRIGRSQQKLIELKGFQREIGAL
ncbi:MAG: hypothetical protein JJT94_15830 [Bernardetiaceae bacterium]|nr:hypothetical protein [Bernardetiaceae bacterium]